MNIRNRGYRDYKDVMSSDYVPVHIEYALKMNAS